MKKLSLFLISVCALLASCTKVAEDPSTIDTRPFPLEENMDKSVRPGDNFFMYCNGAWYNRTELGNAQYVGLYAEAGDVVEENFLKLNNASLKRFWETANSIDDNTAAALEAIKRNLELVEHITTNTEAQDAVVKLMLAGYDNLIKPTTYYRGGRARMLFAPSKSFAEDFNWVEQCLMRFGFADAQARTAKASDLHVRLDAALKPLDVSHENLLKHPELHDRIVPLTQTRSEDAVILEKVCHVLGIDPQDIVVDKGAMAFYMTLDQASPEELQCLLQAYVVAQYRFTSNDAYEEYLTFSTQSKSLDAFLSELKETKLNYIYSYAYATQFVSAEQKETMKRYCEELRAATRQRFAQLDWMSSTTKQKAIEKLDAMTFNVGYPDQWIESALPTLDGASLLENLFALTQSNLNLVKELTGQTAAESSFTNISTELPLYIVNAYYDQFANSMNIYPVWLDKPFYDENLSDAYNYGVLTVIGHEITHGFDANGAQYNKLGDKENWWTVADQMEFKARQQKLIDCYNLLEVMPDELPGVYADGAKTLSENIADLGGVQIAYLAYNIRLEAEGYKGEELRTQQLKFFQGYANLWRSKYTIAIALKENEHAPDKERINGVVMNMDQWYDLYDVQWGDKLYLKPEKRTYLW